jgi:hypothetical protein
MKLRKENVCLKNVKSGTVLAPKTGKGGGFRRLLVAFENVGSAFSSTTFSLFSYSLLDRIKVSGFSVKG